MPVEPTEWAVCTTGSKRSRPATPRIGGSADASMPRTSASMSTPIRPRHAWHIGCNVIVMHGPEDDPIPGRHRHELRSDTSGDDRDFRAAATEALGVQE